MIIAAAVAAILSLIPSQVAAEGFFDFFFAGAPKQQARPASPQPNFFDPFGLNQQQQPPQQQAAAPRVAGGSGPAFCVRSCDGKYFPLTPRGNATPVQLCQAFCPASATKIFFGSNIDSAYASSGERYADSENAFAYRKALRADCTCNGKDPSGLAQVDLTLDTSLHAGDVIATSEGLVAYTGIRVGNNQAADFTPVASYPGLTAEVRARLGEMKVAPVAEMAAEARQPETRNDVAHPASIVPKTMAPKSAKRADAN